MSDVTDLKYLNGYPPDLLAQVQTLLAENRLGEYLLKKYPEPHEIRTDKALYRYVADLRQAHLKNAPAIDKVLYDSKLDVVKHALGLHTALSRNHGGRLVAKKEIRIGSVFRELPADFLKMIVVHELAHLKEMEHNKAFYQLCEYMQPGYAQLEFDLRLYLTWRSVEAKKDC